jgi:hypothetical protein
MIRLYNRAREVLGSDEAATRWMHTKIKALGWHTPFSYADTKIGARVERLYSLCGFNQNTFFCFLVYKLSILTIYVILIIPIVRR